MPMINIEDAYILDETGAQVDQVTGLYFKNENASDTEKAQARANIAAGGSNDNLLDNWYFVGGGSQLGDGVFPINQRGLTSYSANGYGIDRWICYGGAITLAADGLSVPANGVFTQPTDNLTQLNGETLTLSVLYDSGIETGTAVLDLSGTTMFINNGAAGQTYITNGGLVQTYKVTASKIRAIKLELGTVSTLANDVQPNYWLELQKCKARLRFVPLTRCSIVFASGNAYLDLNGCEMEGAPIASLYSNDGAVVGSSGASSAITSVTNIGTNHNVPLLQFNLASAINDQVGQIYNTVVQLSSEL